MAEPVDDFPEISGKVVKYTVVDAYEGDYVINFEDGTRLVIWGYYDRCSGDAGATAELRGVDGSQSDRPE